MARTRPELQVPVVTVNSVSRLAVRSLWEGLGRVLGMRQAWRLHKNATQDAVGEGGVDNCEQVSAKSPRHAFGPVLALSQLC